MFKVNNRNKSVHWEEMSWTSGDMLWNVWGIEKNCVFNWETNNNWWLHLKSWHIVAAVGQKSRRAET